MKLLVITPTLGRSQFLRKTVASVPAVGANVRHVLVCPTSAVEALQDDYPHAEIVGDDAPGVYAAINRGLAIEGQWDAWTWLNDDDLWRVEGIRQALALLQADAGIDLVYGKVDYIDIRGRSLGPLPVETNPSRLQELFAARIPTLTQHGTLVRRGLAERLGPLNINYHHAADFDYWARALAAGARCAFVPAVVAGFRLRGGQLSGDTAGVRHEIETSAAQVFGPIEQKTRRSVVRRFRQRHALDGLRRFLRTGCWRSEQLFRRAAARQGGDAS